MTVAKCKRLNACCLRVPLGQCAIVELEQFSVNDPHLDLLPLAFLNNISHANGPFVVPAIHYSRINYIYLALTHLECCWLHCC